MQEARPLTPGAFPHSSSDRIDATVEEYMLKYLLGSESYTRKAYCYAQEIKKRPLRSRFRDVPPERKLSQIHHQRLWQGHALKPPKAEFSADAMKADRLEPCNTKRNRSATPRSLENTNTFLGEINIDSATHSLGHATTFTESFPTINRIQVPALANHLRQLLQCRREK